MRIYLLFIIFQLALVTQAQTWEPLTYEENQAGLELNPLKGFATIYGSTNDFPHSIEGKLFGLDQVMSGFNTFDFSVIDDFIEQEALNGAFSYIQVNIDPAKDGISYLPSFLDPLVDVVSYDAGDGVAGDCPNYNDPDLMLAMQNFIAAFGAKYNDDERVFLIHLGLYGQWGEWHIESVVETTPAYEMTDANKNIIANAYKAAFPDKLLLARYPENMPDPQAYGYSDGLFFGQSISPTLFYYFHNILKASNADKNWKIHPIGGEVDPALQSTIFDVLPNVVGQDVYACLDSIRPTWLFVHHLLTDAIEGTDEWNNALEVQKAMGYAFHINEYNLSASSGNPAIEVNIQNKGIAPMYANWDIEFAAINASDQFKFLGRTKWNLDLIQPAIDDNYRSFFSDTTLVDGNYTFLLRIVNPLETISANSNPVRFANATQDVDSVGWITLGDKTISSGVAGVTPIPVSDISVSPTSALMQLRDSIQLSTQVFPSTPVPTNPGITWVSDHPGTADVDTNGLVISSNQSGIATISAYTQDGGFLAESVITVEPFRNIPALIEAEEFNELSGAEVEICPEGGFNLGFINNGAWMDYGIKVNTTAYFTIDFRVASKFGSGEIKIVNAAGDTLDVFKVPNTGEWEDYETKTSNAFSLPLGNSTIRLFASEGSFNLNWIEFKYHTPLAAYTFLGTVNDQYTEGANWDAGQRPPNSFNGVINIQADCVVPNWFQFVLGSSGALIVNDNVELTAK